MAPVIPVELMPYYAGALLPALTFHEWGHGYMAHRFGDDTAKYAGRLTFNPLAHLDPLGTIAIFFIGFGWAKPVPVNPRNYRSLSGEFWVPSAGPLMNLVLAVFFALLINFGFYSWFGTGGQQEIATFLMISLQLNLALMFFNLIPIGPLDGSYIFAHVLPLRKSLKFTQWNAQYGSMVLFGAIMLDMFTHIGILRALIITPVQFMLKVLLF